MNEIQVTGRPGGAGSPDGAGRRGGAGRQLILILTACAVLFTGCRGNESADSSGPDSYARLEITGTDMDFPILQSPDDTNFYLTHNEAGKEDDSGSIYTEYYNRKDFSDPNTVIYGRNVEGRFAGLHQFKDRDFFDRHREIKIYLEGETLTWQIFAAYTYDDRHLLMIYDFWDKEIHAAYLKDIFARREMEDCLDETAEVTAEDKIITLSTGVTGQADKRFLVQAVLVAE